MGHDENTRVDAIFTDDRPPADSPHLDRTEVRTGPVEAESVADGPRRGRAAAHGLARSVNLRAAQRGNRPGAQQQIMNLRLERFDEAGERRSPVAVELRGRDVSGQVSDGDEVRAVGRWRGGTLRASFLTNVTTGATVRAGNGFPRWLVAGLAMVLAAAVSVVGYRLVSPAFDRVPHPAPAFQSEPVHSPSSSTVVSTPAPAPGGDGSGGQVVVRGDDGHDGAQTRLVRVPDVTGLSEVDARAALSQDGLYASTRAEETADVPTGTALRTEPPAGTQVAPGGPVVVVVAKPPPDRRVTMPDVVGYSLADATDLLRAAGFTDIAQDPAPFDPALGVPNGVIDTTPAAGERYDPAQTVVLHYMRGQ